MGADVGVFQVADVLTYGYVYTLPLNNNDKEHFQDIVRGDLYSVIVICFDKYLKNLKLTICKSRFTKEAKVN